MFKVRTHNIFPKCFSPQPNATINSITMASNDRLLHAKVKERFERDFLPKYGTLWREMVRAKEPQPTVPLVIDFAEAIHKNISVSITIPSSHDNKYNCGCVSPIVEVENLKDASDISGNLGQGGEVRTGPNNSMLIDLVGNSDSDSEAELEKNEINAEPPKENDGIIDLLSLSDEESFDFPSPKKTPQLPSRKRQAKHLVSYDVPSDSSDESSFEPEFDYEEEMNDLIQTTQSISIQDKENKKSLIGNKTQQQPAEEKRKPIPMSKTAFKKRRLSLTNELFSEFNQKAFGGKLESVQIIWSTKLRTTAGLTRLKKSRQNMRPGIPQLRFATIELSTKVLDNQERLESTLLHEMVHAAAWIIDGVANPPHGDGFWKWARIAMKKVPGIVVTTTHSYEIQYKFAWVSYSCLVLFKYKKTSIIWSVLIH
jgi:predicted SprT family Zn-dependent metalloprotease